MMEKANKSPPRVIAPKAYLTVNGLAMCVAIITYSLWITFADLQNIWCLHNIVLAYFISTFTCYFYVIFLYLKFKARKKYFTELHEQMERGRSQWAHMLWCSLRTSYSACTIFVLNMLCTFYVFGVRNEWEHGSTPTGRQLIYEVVKKIVIFVPEMFIYEIWFDFGHYWGHRWAHYWKWLYDLGHCVHHESVCPDAFDGFNITIDDVILTNWVPHIFSMFMTTKLFFFGRSFSLFEYNVLSSYKAFVEVTGHVGADFRGHSFPLFPPLPYYLGIDIGTAAYHSLHHRYYTLNFSKRFMLWDRVFGTVKYPPEKINKTEIRKLFRKKTNELKMR